MSVELMLFLTEMIFIKKKKKTEMIEVEHNLCVTSHTK